MTYAALNESDLTLTSPAQGKMAELMGQVEENIQGVRVFATPGGCSGVSFGMTFTDQLNDDDKVREYEGVRVIVDSGTLEYIRGVEIDFVDGGNGDAWVIADGTANLWLDAYGNQPTMIGRRAGGTQGSPSAISKADAMRKPLKRPKSGAIF